MRLEHKALVLVGLTIGVLTLASVLVSRSSIAVSFEALERQQAGVESERARRLLDQQLGGLTATAMDYAYWSDTVAFVQGAQPRYFTDNFGTDNMKYLGISQVLLLDALGRPLASAERTDEPALRPVAEAMSQTLRSLAVPVLSDPTSRTVVRTYHRSGGVLYLVAVAAVRSQFEAQAVPSGALAMVRRFDDAELARFSDIVMHPVRLAFPAPGQAPAPVADPTRLEARTPIPDHEGQAVAELILDLPRDLHRAGRDLALAAAVQVALAGLAVGLLLLWLLHRLMLRRLGQVHADLAEITAQGLDGSALLRPQGRDELGELAEGINRLLARVRADAARQREAHAHQEALQQQLLQSQRGEALGRFTGGIAHDFNNSLAAITGWVLLAREELSPGHPALASLDKALESIRYGDGLVRQLLSFSRQTAPRPERVALGALVQETCSLVSLGLMARCTLRVERLTDDDQVLADPTQIKQVLVNLLINACDAMNGQGQITVTLTARREAGAAGHQVMLAVQDSGPGIAPDHLERIFEPFFTTKPHDKGTGLGLSVVQGIVARHGGRITATSEPGQGACFVLTLPGAGAAGDAAAVDAPAARDALPRTPDGLLHTRD